MSLERACFLHPVLAKKFAEIGLHLVVWRVNDGQIGRCDAGDHSWGCGGPVVT